MLDRYKSMLGNTMSVICYDVQELYAEDYNAESLAETSIDYIDAYGNDEEALEEFRKLSYSEMIDIAKEVAKYYI